MDRQPFISVIIPVYNMSKYLNQCLDALIASSYKSCEIIVVDDASTDDSAEISRKKGVTVLQMPHQSGPAAVRNYGAQKARGDILFFVDSDVLVQQETITRIVTDFQKNPDITAVFGSYDDDPAEKDFFSQYKNLYHHSVHQKSSNDAVTFWAGCGAMRRDVFHEVGGFDQKKYTKPSIEDIELGYRLRRMGYRILLDKQLQVKHLKHWGWSSWLKTDIFNRAVPWSQLILERGFLPQDLNLQVSHKISAVLVFLLIIMLPLTLLGALNFLVTNINSVFISISLLLIISLLLLNRNLYAFFFHKRGIKFLLFAIPLHFLYYLYSGLTFATCWILHKFSLFIIDLKKVKTLI